MAQSQEQIPRERAVLNSDCALTLPLDPDVVRFCVENNLSDDVSKAVRLANATFTRIASITAELEIDPDSDDERLILLLTTSASVEEVLMARKAYTWEWIEIAPFAVREKIGLLYTFA